MPCARCRYIEKGQLFICISCRSRNRLSASGVKNMGVNVLMVWSCLSLYNIQTAGNNHISCDLKDHEKFNQMQESCPKWWLVWNIQLTDELWSAHRGNVEAGGDLNCLNNEQDDDNIFQIPTFFRPKDFSLKRMIEQQPAKTTLSTTKEVQFLSHIM